MYHLYIYIYIPPQSLTQPLKTYVFGRFQDRLQTIVFQRQADQLRGVYIIVYQELFKKTS